jgi:hypothetical protein
MVWDQLHFLARAMMTKRVKLCAGPILSARTVIDNPQLPYFAIRLLRLLYSEQ